MKQNTQELIRRYKHFCDNCPKAYDFTCSGNDSNKCGEIKSKLLEEIKTKEQLVT